MLGISRIVDVCAAHHDDDARENFPVRLTMLADLITETVEAARKGTPGPDLGHFERLGFDEMATNRVVAKMQKPTL